MVSLFITIYLIATAVWMLPPSICQFVDRPVQKKNCDCIMGLTCSIDYKNVKSPKTFHIFEHHFICRR